MSETGANQKKAQSAHRSNQRTASHFHRTPLQAWRDAVREGANLQRTRDDVTPGTFKRILKYLMRYPWYMFWTFVVLIVDAAIIAIGAAMIQNVVDDFIMPLLKQSHPDFIPLARFLTVLAGLYVISVLTSWIRPVLLVKIEQGTLKNIRDDMYAHMQKLPISYFDSHEQGDVMSRYTNDTDALRQAISGAFPQILFDGISLICTFAAMLWVSLPLTLVTVVLTALIMWADIFLVRFSGRFFIKQQKDIGRVNGFVDEAVNGQKVIKVFTHEQATERQFDGINDELFRSSSLANIFGNLAGPVVNSLGLLTYTIVAIAGSGAALAGWGNLTLHGSMAMTLGTIIAFISLCRQFINPMGEIAQQVTQVMLAMAGASRIFSLLDEPVEQDAGTVTLANVRENEQGVPHKVDHRTGEWAWDVPSGLSVQPWATGPYPAADGTDNSLVPLRGDIRLSHVNFSYVPGHQILHDITIWAKPGQKVALVGSTGAGKTTITNLINRFYDIDSGSITYDGIDIRDIAKPDLRRSLGIVLQDVNLFTGTVMDNIRYGRLDATDQECVAAAKLANADSFIRMLPDGYNTILIGNGADLSQGQRQLISIARAAVADPPVMILDEATSSIDTRTEQIVQKGMDALMKNRTVFVIAHRLSTVRNSDAIMVIEHGHIIERGTHDQLIAQKGEYYQLYTGAFELQ